MESVDSIEPVKVSHQPAHRDLVFIQDSTEVDTSSKREITYFRLNEMMKFVEYKYKFADPILEYRSMQILFLDSLANDKQLKIDQYKNHSIPALEGKIKVKEETISNQFAKFSIKEAIYESDIAKLIRRKWNYGLFGVGFGVLLSFAGFLLLGGL